MKTQSRITSHLPKESAARHHRWRSLGLKGFALFAAVIAAAAAEPVWQRTTDYPLLGYQYDAVESDGYIYVAGGYNGTRFSDVYFGKIGSDGELGPWTPATALPIPDQGPGLAVYNDWLYCGMGDNGTTWRAHINPDGSLGSWIAEASVDVGTLGRKGVQAYRGYLYRFGRYHSGHYNVVRFARINPDGSLGSWATDTMPQPRHHQGVHFHNGRVYLIGGITSGDVLLNSTYSAPVNSDGSLGSWRREADLPQAIWYHVTALIEGEVYVFGGRTSYWYDQTTDILKGTINPVDGSITEWVLVDSMPSTFVSGLGGVFVPENGTMYLIEGRDETARQFSNFVWYKRMAATPPPGGGCDGSLELLDVAVSTRASQESVDALADAVGQIDVSNLDASITSRASQSSVDALTVSVGNLDLSNLDVPVSTRADQSSVDALNVQLGQTGAALESLVGSRASQASLDALTLALASHRDEATQGLGLLLTLLIESQLANSGPPLAALYLPEAVGGQLELVREQVVTVIQAHQDAGLMANVDKALREVAKGDEEFQEGAYQDAYDHYRRAYRAITRPAEPSDPRDDKDSGKDRKDKDD